MEQSHNESAGPARGEMPDTQAAEKFAKLLKTDHWLRSYMTDMLGAHEIGNGLDFQTAELLLKQERESFEADLAVAQRMHRLYPHLFRQESETAKQGA